MKVLFPAAAAFAASVLSTDVCARAIDNIPSPEEIAQQAAEDAALAKYEALEEKQRQENLAAMETLCDQINLLNDTEIPVSAEKTSGGVLIKPQIAHFSGSAIFFPPIDIETGATPAVIIGWPDVVHFDGEIIEGTTQPVPLLDQTLEEDSPLYYSVGFTAETVTEDVAQPLQCFAAATQEDGGWHRSVSCSDQLGQISMVEVKGDVATLSYDFDVVTSPSHPMRISCVSNTPISVRPPAPETPSFK